MKDADKYVSIFRSVGVEGIESKVTRAEAAGGPAARRFRMGRMISCDELGVDLITAVAMR